MRLDKCLERAEFGSRKRIKTLLVTRQVKVNGQVVTKASQIVDPDLQAIVVGEMKIDGHGAVYYLLNKPKGVVTAVSDSQHQTVIDLISPKDRKAGLYPVGRLDRDTEGLILLTTNGPLGFRMLHPKHHVTKVYEVEVNGFLGDDAVSFFKVGVVFRDGKVCQPADLRILSRHEQSSRASLTIAEGKFHQVKKMFLAYGLKVTHLKRLRLGPFSLDDALPVGDYRPLTPQEEENLLAFFD